MQRIAVTVSAYLLGVASAAFVFQSSNLYINGQLASKSVIQHGGSAYASLQDISHALKMSLKKTVRGYELADEGGANQIEGQNGKVGETVWNGYMRFSVVKVIRTEDYETQFAANAHHITPGANNDLVVVVCKIKNGMKTKSTPSEIGGQNTGLTDIDGHSYPLKDSDTANNGPELLPGAAADFALIYEIPKKEAFKDFVYQYAFFYTPDMAAQGKMMRISLSE